MSTVCSSVLGGISGDPSTEGPCPKCLSQNAGGPGTVATLEETYPTPSWSLPPVKDGEEK